MRTFSSVIWAVALFTIVVGAEGKAAASTHTPQAVAVERDLVNRLRPLSVENARIFLRSQHFVKVDSRGFLKSGMSKWESFVIKSKEFWIADSFVQGGVSFAVRVAICVRCHPDSYIAVNAAEKMS